MSFLDRLRHQTVLITGASAGIGEATAREFAKAGSRVVLAARRMDKLERIKEDLVNNSKVAAENLHIVALDVCDRQQVKQMVETLPESFSAITILVNNAGLAVGVSKTYEHSDEQIDRMIDTNVKGALYVIRAIVPGMLERKEGHIINVSSIAGMEAYPNGAVYCASKHALQAINHSLRKELVSTPLRVTSICPGLVQTEFSIVRFNDESANENVYKGIEPLNAADIAETIIFSASRPPHVQISEIIIFPTNQASTEVIYRQPQL